MKRWDQRPVEIRNLFNPAFCGLVLSRALHGYEDADARGMPFSLTLLVLPLGSALMEAWQKPWDPAQGYTYVAFGRYPTDQDGTERPIAWRVLESKDGVLYLLSEYILDVSKLHHVANGYPGWPKADLNAWLQKVEDDGVWEKLWKVCMGARIGQKTAPKPPAIED